MRRYEVRSTVMSERTVNYTLFSWLGGGPE